MRYLNIHVGLYTFAHLIDISGWPVDLIDETVFLFYGRRVV